MAHKRLVISLPFSLLCRYGISGSKCCVSCIAGDRAEAARLFLGLILGISYGAGSFWSFVGGKLGDLHSKKLLSIAGNLMIPLMSFSVLAGNIAIIALLFIFGWWGRYFRTPTRRAWLVEVTEPDYRAKVFGFLHALDIGGGIIA